MKLRMAENSLFAVLLRRRWWVSLAVAAVIVAVASALLPPDLRVVGSLACVPFVVISAMAFWRQRGLPAPAEVERLLAQAAGMAWPQLEAALRAGFVREGHSVLPAPPGADLLLERDGRRVLVGARRWKAARHGAEALQPLLDAMQRAGIGHGAWVALGELTPQARQVAKSAGVELLEGDALARLLR